MVPASVGYCPIMAPATRPFTDYFRSLHTPIEPLVVANPWDPGSARLFESLGYLAIATTSSGHAMTLGRMDGAVKRHEALEHAATMVEAVSIPVTADLEWMYGHSPEEVAQTALMACETGVAGLSIEDYTGDPARPIFDISLSTERVAAVVETVAKVAPGIVVTARAESALREEFGVADLDSIIERLQRYEAVGADCLYAPGLTEQGDIERVVSSLSKPINVLARPRGPSVADLGKLGVSRVSVGGSMAFATFAAAELAAREVLELGTFAYMANAAIGSAAATRAFSQAEAG